jgi:trans-AT polyketide synthase, acyltransferase and oxidoreductase domains
MNDAPRALGWRGDLDEVAYGGAALADALGRVREPLHVVEEPVSGALGVAAGGALTLDGRGDALWRGTLPPLYPEWLGDRGFLAAHGVRFPYIAGEMAGGIASPAMVIAMARAGMLGFLGTAGLSLARIGSMIDAVEAEVGQASWGANLIHSPHEPAIEEATVDLYLRRGVTRVSASAFMRVTESVVRYACTGLARLPDGQIARRHHLFAKVSRPEVAAQFLAPAPAPILAALVAAGRLTAAEAELAARLPLAEDLTVEADSGGHTDNRPLAVVLPAIAALRDRICAEHAYPRPVRVGAAGGLGTPAAVAAAFALGAAYVLTGSINQCTVEADTSEEVKRLLAAAGLADVAMAPAADMFELGVKVQVLRRGTMFAQRAAQLHQLYLTHRSLEELPDTVRKELETRLFQRPLGEVWAETRRYWLEREPAQALQGDADARHRMALVFRWYLGNGSRCACAGAAGRVLDYQVWCGPAMGGFNAWVAGSFLAEPAAREVVQIALNLLEGAAVATRAQQLRTYGLDVPAEAFAFRPRPLS